MAQKKSKGNTVIEIKLDKLAASSTNPRKFFDPEKHKELTASIKEKGVIEPIIARKSGCGFIIVAGERRARAAKAAGLKTIPALVMKLTDNEAIELQVIENMQRQDLRPMEEAHGYALLHKTHKMPFEEIALKVGKSKQHVFTRVKFLNLAPAVQEAIDRGRLKLTYANKFLLVPDHTSQVKLLADCGRWIESMGELNRHLQENYLLEIRRAPFNTHKKDLVPGKGACKDCKERTGAQRTLFADVSKQDVCNNKSCWQAKTQAHAKNLIEKYRAEGKTIHTGKQAAEIQGKYTSLDDTSYKIKGGKTWRQALKGLDYESIIVMNDKNTVSEWIDEKKAIRLIPKSGLSTYAAGNVKTETQKNNDARARQLQALKIKAVEKVEEMVVNKIMGKIEKKDGLTWPEIMPLLGKFTDYSTAQDIIKKVEGQEVLKKVGKEYADYENYFKAQGLSTDGDKMRKIFAYFLIEQTGTGYMPGEISKDFIEYFEKEVFLGGFDIKAAYKETLEKLKREAKNVGKKTAKEKKKK